MVNVIFPDEFEEGSFQFDNINPDATDMTREGIIRCPREGDIYCENIDQYPGEIIAKLMKHKENQELLNDSVIENSLSFESRIQNRGTIRLCKSRRVVIYPRLAVTTDNHWSYIINQDQNVQSITVELCEHTNQCAFAKSFPNGKVTQCEQIHHQQLLLSFRNGKVIQSLFQMPSHCECTWLEYGP